MRIARKAPRLRTRFTVLTTLLCVCALLLLGGALILIQARDSRASTRAEIEYALSSTNAATRTQMTYLTRVIRDLRNDPAFTPFWTGDEAGWPDAQESLSYCVDLYSDQNLMSGSVPFLTMAAIFHETDVIYCAYYPTTQAESQRALSNWQSLRDSFLLSGAERHIEVDETQIYLITRLYDLNMEPLGEALFAIGVSALNAQYAALKKYEGALYALRDADGQRIAGGTALDRAYLSDRLSLPFGLTAVAMVPEEQIGRLMRPALFSMAIALILLLPAIALIASAIAYSYSRPLKVVADRIGRVEAGDYTAKLNLPNWAEFQNIGARFNAMTDTIHHLVTEVYEKQLLAKESEIKFLQSQMNPHFMYNVLAMIAMTAKRNGDEEAYRLLHSFSALSRARVFTDAKRMITLRQELDLVNDYLFLQCKRYEDRITYEIDCDESLMNIPLPRLCIEPIVENAFLHGMEPKGRGHVCVRARKEGKVLTVYVTDDGVGFSEKEFSEGVGIINTRRILKNVFGAAYGVTIHSEPGAGTTAVVTLPAEGGDVVCLA